MRLSATLGVALIATVPATLSAQDPGDVQGLYVFRVLSMDREEVVAEGQFVLGAEEFDLEEIDDEVLSFATERSFWLLRRGETPARVCFGFERSQDYVEGREFYGGIIPVGLSNWTVERGELRIHVYQSPDASQHLAGRVTEEGLEGRVLQRDWDARGTGAPVEWLPFEAERIGEASTGRCEEVLRIVGERESVGAMVRGLGAQNRAQEITDGMLAAFDPELIRRAEERGLYDRETLPVFRGMNPFFLRGDFNGDGGMDVAFWVREPGSGERGVAILHSTLDTLFVYGAGRPGPAPDGHMPNEGRVDAWHGIPAGHVDEHHYGNLPEIGVVEGSSFMFQRETLEFVFLGKSAFVFYWANGRYWLFWTSD